MSGRPVLRVVKGHGMQNDFVVLPDLDGEHVLTESLTRALCDRRAGIGADGVLRVVRSANDPDGKPFTDEAEFFMDYRNADGSLAETCGNGVRVFARYLQRAALIDRETVIATRGGTYRAGLRPDGLISVDMGRPQLLDEAPRLGDKVGRAVLMPNPHVVVAVDDESLGLLDLSRTPEVIPSLPDGQNIEFVARPADRQLRLRVHERGVGETRSCGTGLCAAVAVFGTPDGVPWQVAAPGGIAEVVWAEDGNMTLTGPAVLVGDVELTPEWLTGVARG